MMHQLLKTGVLQRVGFAGLSLVLVFALASCGKDEAPPAPQAPPVTVSHPVVGPVANFMVFTGSSRAIETADVVARVSGVLESVEFQASSPVKAGDLLFTIEDERYLAARNVALAAEKSAEADLLRSETELRRVEKASHSRAVSEMDVDRARADRDMAEAAVASAKAHLADAELTLSYTRVRAPIDGFVSRNLVDVGNLVGQGGVTSLTRINKISPIYVYFHAPESVVLKYLAEKEGSPEYQEDGSRNMGQAEVALAGEEGFPHQGYIDFIDNQVDSNTGTIELRARLDNSEGRVFPGLFVRIKVTGEVMPDAVLVPATAIGSDLGGKFILVVGEENIVEQKYVKLGATQEDGSVHVRSGLEGNETIIVGGLMFARPGLPVNPLTAEQFEAMKKKAE